MIQDAIHNNGNAFFFWLSPVINQHAPASQAFSGHLSPVVTITELISSGVCQSGRVVRTFSGADISVSNAAYHVNWKTAQDNLNSACTYRVTVTVGPKPALGFADVDVVDSGRELKNVNTNEYIPLLDDRTLPLQFFIGVGSQCESVTADCGEGTARGGQNTTIVTTNGRAGVFIPANALGDGEAVTISVESVDGRTRLGECIPGLLQQYPGTPGVADNACYDYHAVPLQPGIEQVANFRFRNPVTVGICPDVQAFALDHATLDLLQIVQFDAGLPFQALDNVPAPFLRCDPHFSSSVGARRSLLGELGRSLASLVSPRALYARSNRMMFDLGAGGSTEGFSRFTWALPNAVNINFDIGADGRSTVKAGTAVNALYSRIGVTFSRSNPTGLCAGTGVYANDHGPLGFNSGQNNITVCPEGVASDFSETAFGTITATFTEPQALVCIGATPLSPPIEGTTTAFIEALDASGATLSRVESAPSSPTPVQQTLCISGEAIASVRFAGTGTGFAIFDNLSFVRVPQDVTQ